jgi:AraC-like DNA-binding protein
VKDVICDHGPGDRAFEERHETACLAFVCAGTFSYRSHQGAALLMPGSVLLGNAADCFECGHEHSRGDRCLSFHLSPEFMEEIAAHIPGVRTSFFDLPRLPPLQSLMPVLAAAETARDACAKGQLEEIAVHLAAETLKVQSTSNRSRTPSSRDLRRVCAIVDWIETHEQDSPTLSQLARVVSMSRYHFLRTFRAVTGTTPYQYLLARRLRLVSTDLRRASSPISQVAYNAGYRDLSTFNRRFRRVAKTTPRQYRQSIHALCR